MIYMCVDITSSKMKKNLMIFPMWDIKKHVKVEMNDQSHQNLTWKL